ncbi:unnamed protein product [Nezara viridula]|uniref:Ig-like domain-containing protein n=1 Tax=Nezara viridula TaxID=85310 RepID=A0A9P0HLE8_NEZVI|nr:unnamed protein product [Nezara viridula]
MVTQMCGQTIRIVKCSPELSMDDMLEKMKELERAGRRRWESSRATQSPEEMPVFDTTLVTNVTAQLGATAFLRCRVKNLKNRAVSWVRKRDWHILTSAMFTYTNDERFQVLHTEGSDDWTLQIKYVQKRDDGAYECQSGFRTAGVGNRASARAFKGRKMRQKRALKNPHLP